MRTKRIIKLLTTIILSGLTIGILVTLYMFNMPHKNIQSSKTDFVVTAHEIVTEYLNDQVAANDKYLKSDGNSSILEVTGEVIKVLNDFDNNKIILLKGAIDKAGVQCSFTAESNSNAELIEPGHMITIKGVIRAGAGFDKDLGLYENIVMEKCDIISNFSTKIISHEKNKKYRFNVGTSCYRCGHWTIK